MLAQIICAVVAVVRKYWDPDKFCQTKPQKAAIATSAHRIQKFHSNEDNGIIMS